MPMAMGSDRITENGTKTANHVGERPESTSLCSIEAPQKEYSNELLGSCTRGTHSFATSQASTERYQRFQHVPFAQFKLQVEDLCLSLWPTPDDRPNEIHLHNDPSERFTSACKSQQRISSSQSSPASSRFVIEHLRGGSYNRVLGITRLDINDEGESRMILRVPRGNMHPLDHDICVLKFAQKYFNGPCPRLLAHDLTFVNPLKAPYLLQERILGHDLESKAQSYPSLTQAQKIAFVEEFAQLFVNIQAIEHPYAGNIDISTDNTGAESFIVTPFEVPTESADLMAKRAATIPFFKPCTFDIKYTSPEKVEDKSTDQTPYHLIMTQLGRRKHLELELCPQSIGNSIIDRLANAATQLEDMGYLYCDSNCLTHYDLDPRNIMVDIQADGALKITGILDWDLAMFAPKWVAYRPPIWIWNWLDGGSEDERRANEKPPTAEQQKLKELWEDLLGPDFEWYGYQPHYRLARRLFCFVAFGLTTAKHFEDAERFLEEWEALRESTRESDGESWGDGAGSEDEVGE